MTWIDSRKFGEKIVNVLSDNRATPSEWKQIIPLYIVQQPITIVMNAKYLADGINEHIEMYHPDVDFYMPSGTSYIQEYLF